MNLNKIQTKLLQLTIFLTPLFFLPLFPEPFNLPKKLLFGLLVMVNFTLFLVERIQKKKFPLVISPFLPILLLLTILSFVSAAITTGSLAEALIGRPTDYLLLVFFFILLTNLKNKKGQFKALILSTVIVALTQVIAFILFQTKINQSLPFNLPEGWTPVGNLFNHLLLTITILVLLITQQLKSTKYYILNTIYYILLSLSTASLFYLIISNFSNFVFLPLSAGWRIAIEAISRSPLIGVGPGNYFNFFTRVRPVDLNLSNQLWLSRFSSSSNEFIHVLTTLGMPGFFLFTWIFYRFFKLIKKSPLSSAAYCIFPILIYLLIQPASFFALFLLIFFLAALRSKADKTIYPSFAADATELLPSLATFLFAPILILFFWHGAKITLAEISLQQSFIAYQANDGSGTYANQIKALRYAPYLDNYLRAYAQTNLQLALTLSQEEDLTQEQVQTITTFIQQAIDAGKASTQLDSQDVRNWEVLASIYNNLIGSIDEADQWTIATLQQAIQLDPTNPQLQFDLATIFYTLEEYQAAAEGYRGAASLKPDWANARYNLALALEQLDEPVAAYEQLLVAQQLLPNDPNIKTKLDELVKILEEKIEKAELEQESQPSEVTEITTPEESQPSPFPTEIPLDVEGEITPTP